MTQDKTMPRMKRTHRAVHYPSRNRNGNIQLEGDMADVICEIRRAGITPEGLAQLDVRSQNGSFDWTWVLSKDGLGREMLATALAAIVSGKFIECVIEDPVLTWSRVTRLLIVK